MTLAEAKEAILVRGTLFSEVVSQIEDHNVDALKDWFVHAEGVPNLVARDARRPQWLGEMCPKCGGMMVQTGSCKTCSACGTSSGGCG